MKRKALHFASDVAGVIGRASQGLRGSGNDRDRNYAECGRRISQG